MVKIYKLCVRQKFRQLKAYPERRGQEDQVQEEEEVPRGVVVDLEETLPGEEGNLQALEHLVPLIDAAVGEASASAS